MTRWPLVLLASLALLAGCGDDTGDSDKASAPDESAPGAHETGAAWSYEENGGPEKWGSLSDDYMACEKGTEQSPIDLGAAKKDSLPELEFDYVDGPAVVDNKGHTVEVIYEPGSTLTVDGAEYSLIQSHYHLPSEHEVDSMQEPIEMHFVHENVDAEILVVGAFVKVGDPNAEWDKIAAALPAKEGQVNQLQTVNPLDLLPQDVGQGLRWSYDGSLTTPPCSEGVEWNVLKTRITMSSTQILEFKAVYEANRRPVQPLNGRELVLGQPE